MTKIRAMNNRIRPIVQRASFHGSPWTVLPMSSVIWLVSVVMGWVSAVQMVIGNRPVIPTALTQPMTTLTSQITLDMGNTVQGEPWNEALWTMGLILLFIALIFVTAVRRMGRRTLPQ